MHCQKPNSLGYIFVANDTVCLDSVNLMQMALKAVIQCEIMRNDDRLVVQGHLRSRISIPVKRTYVTSYLTPFPIYPMWHIGQIMAFNRRCLYWTPSFRLNPGTLDCKTRPQKARNATLSCGAPSISIQWTV